MKCHELTGMSMCRRAGGWIAMFVSYKPLQWEGDGRENKLAEEGSEMCLA
jgi:hypothetical protein